MPHESGWLGRVARFFRRWFGAQPHEDDMSDSQTLPGPGSEGAETQGAETQGTDAGGSRGQDPPAPADAGATQGYSPGAVFGDSIRAFQAAAQGTTSAVARMLAAQSEAESARVNSETASARAEALIAEARMASESADARVVAAEQVRTGAIRDEIVAAENVQHAAAARIADLRQRLPSEG